MIKSLMTPSGDRTKDMNNVLKNYVKYHVPLMESRYCQKDDFSYVAEHLKYKFVKKGHYAVR